MPCLCDRHCGTNTTSKTKTRTTQENLEKTSIQEQVAKDVAGYYVLCKKAKGRIACNEYGMLKKKISQDFKKASYPQVIPCEVFQEIDTLSCLRPHHSVFIGHTHISQYSRKAFKPYPSLSANLILGAARCVCRRPLSV